MARKGYTPPQVGSSIDNTPTGVIWGYGWDYPNNQAEKDAFALLLTKGCKASGIKLSSEQIYDHEDVKKVHEVSYCITNDQYIAEDYKKAGIEVLPLGELTDEEIAAARVATVNSGTSAAGLKEQADAMLDLELEREALEREREKFEAEKQELADAKAEAETAQKDASKSTGSAPKVGKQASAA